MVLVLLYDLVMVGFVAVHLLVGGALTFGAGVYAGIYACQNYTIPRVDDPTELMEKVREFTDKYRKD